MIQLKRLGHVLIKVADVERSKAFYRDLLGSCWSATDRAVGVAALDTRC